MSTTSDFERIGDELLVLAAQDGDAAAMDALVARWQPRLRWYAWQSLGHQDLAADAVQETWLAAIRNLHRLRDPASWRAWLYRLLTNKCSDQIRKRQRRREADLTDASFLAPEHAASDHSGLKQALTQLSPAHRQVLILHHLDDISVAEIATILGIPSGTVKSRLHHARQHLCDIMTRSGP